MSNKLKNKVGRPRLPEELKRKYQRVAIFKHTYARILLNASKENLTLSEYIEKHIPKT